MADKVAPGQRTKMSPFVSKAATINDGLDCIDDLSRRRLGNPSPSTGQAKSTDCVEIKNISGADLLRGNVVQLGDSLLTVIDPWNLCFEGNAVAAPAHERYAIARDAIKEDSIWFAQVSGVCVAKVDVGNILHRYAFPTAAATVLTSEMAGPIELLSPPDGTGEQDMIVRLAVAWPVLRGKTDSSHAKGAYGTVSIYSGTANAKSDTTVNVTDVWNPFADLDSGMWVDVTWIDGQPELTAAEC